jgi:hypothetical protein
MSALEDLMPSLRFENPTRAEEINATIQSRVLGTQKRWILLPDQYYAKQVFSSSMNVVEVFNQLKLSLFYLNSNALAEPHDAEPPRLTEWAWIEYHCWHFITMLTALPDTTLILVNDVLSLGNLAKNCRPDIIKKNVNVPSTVVAALDQISQNVGEFKPGRHALLHHGKAPDLAKMMKSETLAKMEMIYKAIGLSKSYKPPLIMPAVVKSEVKKLNDKFEHVALASGQATHHLMDLLAPIYEKAILKLRVVT